MVLRTPMQLLRSFNRLGSQGSWKKRFTSASIDFVAPKGSQRLAPNRAVDNRIVGYWLAGSSALVFGIIVFGGLTRLTESGLSMVDWKLIHFKPPSNEVDWQEYFNKYKQFPEYQMYKIVADGTDSINGVVITRT